MLDNVLRIRNSDWTIAAFILVADGVLMAVIGLLPWIGLNDEIAFPQSVVLLGLTIVTTGAWMVYRPRETTINTYRRTITVRQPTHERTWSFNDVFHIELHCRRFLPVLPEPVAIRTNIYDVVLCFRDETREVTHSGLTLPAARSEARRLAMLIGAQLVDRTEPQ